MKEQIEHATVVSLAKKLRHTQPAADLAPTGEPPPAGVIRALSSQLKRQIGTISLGWRKLG